MRLIPYIFISTVIVLSVSCKKQREDKIIGRWEKVNITDVDMGNYVEVWNFENEKDLKILKINDFPKDTIIDSCSYSFDDYKTIKVVQKSGWEEKYEIVNIEKKLLRINQMDGEVVAYTKEFFKLN